MMQSAQIRMTTLIDYTSKVKNYIIKPLGDMHMGDVTADAYIVVFEKMIMEISYPKFFLDGTINVE